MTTPAAGPGAGGAAPPPGRPSDPGSTTYEDEVLRQIDAFDDYGLYVGSVVITQ